MSVNLMLDTNVLVYAYDRSNPAKQERAIETLDRCVNTKRAAVSVQVLSEFIVVASRKLDPPLQSGELQTSIDRLSQSLIVLPLTAFIVRDALRGANAYQMSYWDAQIWASAHMNQIPLILTEDVPSQQNIEGVAYRNPFASDLAYRV